MLALISGRGLLPAQVAAAQDIAPLICVLAGFEPDDLDADITFRLEQLGSFLVTLAEKGVTEVCFCGAIERPVIDPKMLDAETRPLLPVLQTALTSGDDAALRGVIGLFEQTGFVVRAAHELAPDLVAPPGVLGIVWPSAQMRHDAAKGAAVLAALAPMDVGQACVVGGGQVLAIETLFGTDFMIAGLPQDMADRQAILIKGPKVGQDARADMPTIGPATIAAAHKAGLVGVVIDAGDVIVLEQAQTVARADELGLVLWSRTGD
ncbi:MAG: UDP-2,3-diacylglucosamine diphosphatase LpxI [Sulfitobacter sp.]